MSRVNISRYHIDICFMTADDNTLNYFWTLNDSAIYSSFFIKCRYEVDLQYNFFLISVALEAIKMNCELNGVYLDTSSDDVIGSKIGDWDVVFLGDMFYDSDFADLFSQWLPRLSRSGVNIYVGDPGRLPLVNHPLKRNLVSLFRCPLPENCLRENNGMSTGTVWKYTG